jgi:hypothetical protein
MTIVDLIRRDGREPGGILRESPFEYLKRIPVNATLYDLARHGVVINQSGRLADARRGERTQGVQMNTDELQRWATAARLLFSMMIRKPYGTWNECRICGGTWWDNEHPRHRFDCAAVEAIKKAER